MRGMGSSFDFDSDDLKDVTALRILDKALEYWWDAETKLSEVVPEDFIISNKAKLLTSIIRTAGNKDANRIYIKYLNKLHKEINSVHPYYDLIKTYMNVTWEAYMQAVSETSIDKDNTIRLVVLKGLGFATLLNEERFISDDVRGDDEIEID